MTARSNYRYEKNMVGFEKALEAVNVIKDQIQYRSQSLLNLSYNYTMRFIGYDFIQSRWFISYRF